MTAKDGREEAGAAVVEFVLVMLILVPLVLGILQFGMVLHVRNTLASAAAEGAREAALLGSSAEAGEARVRHHVDLAFSPEFEAEIDVHPATVAGAPGYAAVVTAEVPTVVFGSSLMRVQVSGHAISEASTAGVP